MIRGSFTWPTNGSWVMWSTLISVGPNLSIVCVTVLTMLRLALSASLQPKSQQAGVAIFSFFSILML